MPLPVTRRGYEFGEVSSAMQKAFMRDQLAAVNGSLADSVIDVAARQREAGVAGMEVQNPGNAAQILNAMADGEPSRKIIRNFRVGGSLLTRMRRDHAEVLAESRRVRAQAAAEVADPARELLTRKIDQLAGDGEALAKANLKDVGITYGITIDKSQLLANDPTMIVGEPTKKITINDAIEAIAAAKAAVAEKVEAERSSKSLGPGTGV